MYPLPELPYGYGDLAPVISETTLRTHHLKHHARYVQVTNELVAASADHDGSLEQVVAQAEKTGARKLFNNAAQAWNHGFFWACMRPGGSQPAGALAQAIDGTFGGLSRLRDAFVTEGANHFGSGWAWLIANGDQLSVTSTHDAGVPITAPGVTPLLVCDVWEHAYYLDHKNDRGGFIGAWWDLLVDWEFVARQHAAARTGEAPWSYPRAQAGG